MTTFIILELIQYFLQLVLTRATRILNLFSKSKFSKPTHDSRLSRSHLSFTNKTVGDDESLQRGDLEAVMADLGVFYHAGGEKLPEVLNSKYISEVFEVEQPKLDEVKEAFDVFDVNKDGFIDAGELKRILGVLVFKESADLESCRKMIGVFDEDADGKIDFSEFVKFMENTLC